MCVKYFKLNTINLGEKFQNYKKQVYFGHDIGEIFQFVLKSTYFGSAME